MMKFVVFALFCLFACAYAGEVRDLTPETFDAAIAEPYTLVMFMAPWCGHCKNLKPHFADAAAETEEFVLAQVDCTQHQGLCGKYDVSGYPTVIFFKKGTQIKFDGQRTKEGILSWLEKKSGPPSRLLESAEAVTEFKAGEANGPIAIGYFDAAEGDAFANFEAAADDAKTDDIKFAHVTDSALFDGNAAGSVSFLRGDLGEDQVIQAADEDLADQLFQGSFPPVGEVGPENFGKYSGRGTPLHLTFVDLNDADSLAAVKTSLKAAYDAHPEFSYGYIDGVKFKSNLERMGASGNVMPAIIRLNFKDNKPVVYEREMTPESVVEWVEGVVSGKYKYQPKSEPAPEEPTVGGLTTLVGSTFDAVVNDASKDVLVEFYAPWCGHCKSLKPEYEKLAADFEADENIVIAAIDLTSNDVEPGYQVRGFPTILLYTSDAKDTPKVFEGTRTADAIAKWVRESATVEVSGAKDEL